jgi:predicted adenylyl cyclase CyaB
MSWEIEAKLPVDSLAPTRQALADLAATPLGRVAETNHILDAVDGRLRHSGCALRLRVNQSVDGGRPEARLTFKGPVQSGRLKRRPEIELVVADPRRALELLGALGFVEIMLYRKRRESHRLENCRIELDEMPYLGCFVEIEGPDEDTIVRVQNRIGLAGAAHQPRSYVALLRDYCEHGGLDPRRIDFPTP